MKKILALVLFVSSFASAQFSYTRDVDSMTDKNKSFIAAESLESGFMENAVLYVRCDSGEKYGFDVYVATQKYFKKGNIDAQYRFDSKPASKRTEWISSTDGQGLFATDALKKTWVSQALKSKKMLLRVWDFNNTAYNYTFNLSGLAANLKKLGCVKL